MAHPAGVVAVGAEPTPRAKTPSADVKAVVDRVQGRYEATNDFAADFSQELRIEAGGQVVQSGGKMFFARPGRMRWEYESPEPQTIVADGETLWIYQPADKQVLRAPLREAFQSRTPVSFLLGVARLDQDFRPALLPPAPDGSLRLALDPVAAEDGSLGSLVLDVDPVTFDIRAATIKDPLGNTTRVTLASLRRNQGLDEALFRFERPPGTDVIDAPGR